jgi:hypothetical protein
LSSDFWSSSKQSGREPARVDKETGLRKFNKEKQKQRNQEKKAYNRNDRIHIYSLSLSLSLSPPFFFPFFTRRVTQLSETFFPVGANNKPDKT